jgi:hypothetical protein
MPGMAKGKKKKKKTRKKRKRFNTVCKSSINAYHIKNQIPSQVLVAHSCNSSYSGGRDLEDTGSRPAQTKSSQYPISTNSWAWWHTSVIPATMGSINRRKQSLDRTRKNQEPISN